MLDIEVLVRGECRSYYTNVQVSVDIERLKEGKEVADSLSKPNRIQPER